MSPSQLRQSRELAPRSWRVNKRLAASLHWVNQLGQCWRACPGVLVGESWGIEQLSSHPGQHPGL